MAVRKGTFTETEGEITITNGDFQALRKIAESYGLADESDVIAFAIGVLSRANGGAISVDQADGTVAKFIPADKLRTKTS
jgi:hypothetical protein